MRVTIIVLVKLVHIYTYIHVYMYVMHTWSASVCIHVTQQLTQYSLPLQSTTQMLNLTSRLAIQMQNMPGGDVDWADCRPQKRRSSPTCSDFLPDDNDVVHLHKRAVQLIMEVLVAKFKSLNNLQPHLPQRESPHPIQKTVVVPMQILFKDEKFKAETIQILSDLMKDAGLSGEPQGGEY